jgi:hypothetical protein
VRVQHRHPRRPFLHQTHPGVLAAVDAPFQKKEKTKKEKTLYLSYRRSIEGEDALLI